MANEAHDPWALLREARESLDGVVDCDHPVGMSNAESRAVECIKRIDAALAAHDAVPPSEVEWIPNGLRGLSGYLKGRVEKASVYQTKDGLWWAYVADIGPFETLDEVQRAALAAARGMK